MVAQKIIFKLLNITKYSIFLGALFFIQECNAIVPFKTIPNQSEQRIKKSLEHNRLITTCIALQHNSKTNEMKSESNPDTSLGFQDTVKLPGFPD